MFFSFSPRPSQKKTLTLLRVGRKPLVLQTFSCHGIALNSSFVWALLVGLNENASFCSNSNF